MARILLGAYMVRYPLGGMLAGYVQWLVGLRLLGHEVYVVEKAAWPNACFDPRSGAMSDDCAYGVDVVERLLGGFGLPGRLCFVDVDGGYHGLSRSEVERLFVTADLFVDFGTHGTWLEEAEVVPTCIYIDGEPGARQIKMQLDLDAGGTLPAYSAYYTVGQNIGTPAARAPTAGLEWRHVFHPVVVDLFWHDDVPAGDAYTTVMNWRSHEPVRYRGTTYGQKDQELARFVDLPRRCDVQLELALSGAGAAANGFVDAGWRVRDGHAVTRSYDSFIGYVRGSRGEFGVCKHAYVETWSGWFSDRSAVYLASGRPVVLQDTGFSEHLPCGEGLFAVRTLDDAVAALREIERDHTRHARAARALAREHFDARKVLGGMLEELGV